MCTAILQIGPSPHRLQKIPPASSRAGKYFFVLMFSSKLQYWRQSYLALPVVSIASSNDIVLTFSLQSTWLASRSMDSGAFFACAHPGMGNHWRPLGSALLVWSVKIPVLLAINYSEYLHFWEFISDWCSIEDASTCRCPAQHDRIRHRHHFSEQPLSHHSVSDLISQIGC